MLCVAPASPKFKWMKIQMIKFGASRVDVNKNKIKISTAEQISQMKNREPKVKVEFTPAI